MSNDIVGYNDYVGANDDLDSLLQSVAGADIVGKSGGRSQVNAARLPISFVGLPITTLSTSPATIQVPILRQLRPDRLVIERVGGPTINVQDIKVGTVSLNASVNPVPADCFAPDAMGTALRAVVTATPSVGLSITVFSTTGTPVLRGAFFGPSLPG